MCLGSACGLWWDQAAPTIRIRGAGVEVRRGSQGGIPRPKNRCFGHSQGISRLQRVREVATCPQRQPTDRVDSVTRVHAARLRFGSSHPQTGLAPGPSSDVDQNSEFSLFPLLFFRQNAGKQTLLTAVLCFNHESVFAPSVEKTRPMAGRPVWRQPFLGSTDILGISRGYIYACRHLRASLVLSIMSQGTLLVSWSITEEMREVISQCMYLVKVTIPLDYIHSIVAVFHPIHRISMGHVPQRARLYHRSCRRAFIQRWLRQARAMYVCFWALSTRERPSARRRCRVLIKVC